MRAKPTRDNIIEYIQDVHVNGYTKRDAYAKNIADVSQVGQAVVRLEKSSEYKDMYEIIMSDENMRLKKKATEVQRKYVELIGKNIDMASGILDDVKNEDLTSKAVAVRLVNETVGAMGVVSGPVQAQPPGKLNRAGVVV